MKQTPIFLAVLLAGVAFGADFDPLRKEFGISVGPNGTFSGNACGISNHFASLSIVLPGYTKTTTAAASSVASAITNYTDVAAFGFSYSTTTGRVTNSVAGQYLVNLSGTIAGPADTTDIYRVSLASNGVSVAKSTLEVVAYASDLVTGMGGGTIPVANAVVLSLPTNTWLEARIESDNQTACVISRFNLVVTKQ